MSIENQIAVRTTPAIVEVNFDELKASLAAELKKYDVLVSADAIPEARKLMADLNKTKKAIADARKAEVAKASEPIKQFDDQMKQLEVMCAEGRSKLETQVKNYEAEQAQIAEGLLDGLRHQLWMAENVADEFKSAEYDDLVRAASLTATGKLTKKAIDTLDERVKQDKANQTRTESRLLELENRSFKAGLAAPLTRDHVAAFLFAPDEVYNREVERIIRAEIQREEMAAAARKQAEQRRADAAIEAEKAHPSESRAEPNKSPEVAAQPLPEHEKQPEREPSAPMAGGRVMYEVTATFKVPVAQNVTEGQIRRQCVAIMEKAGITTLESVGVRRA